MEDAKKAVEDLVKEKIREAKIELKSTEEIAPKCFFMMYYPTDNKYSACAVMFTAEFFKDGIDRKSLVPHIKKSWKTLKYVSVTHNFPAVLIGVVLICDSWMVTRSTEDLEKPGKIPMPSTQPDKIEAINCLIDMNKNKFGYWYPYERIGDRIVFEPERRGGVLANDERFNFTNLWPEDPA